MQEILQVVEVIVSLPRSVPQFVNTRSLRVHISILYNYVFASVLAHECDLSLCIIHLS
jgi:hypothetical protein